MDCRVHGILQVRILEWVAISSSRGSSQARDRTRVSCIAGGFFTSWATREAHWMAYLCSVTQSYPTLCDPMDCSPPGSSVHGIFQARRQEWVAISSSRGSSRPRYRIWVSCVSCIGRWVLYHWATREALLIKSLSVNIGAFPHIHTYLQIICQVYAVPHPQDVFPRALWRYLTQLIWFSSGKSVLLLPVRTLAGITFFK